MCLSQGPSYISPVLPEAAKNLLSSLEEYKASGDFQGAQDSEGPREGQDPPGGSLPTLPRHGHHWRQDGPLFLGHH